MPKLRDPLLKRMLKYSLPLVPNSLAWWVNGYSSRLILLAYIGVGPIGLVSAANKVPSIINSVQGFFGQALTLSVIEVHESKAIDARQYYLSLYEYYSLLMAFTCSLIIMFNPLLSLLLFQGEFISAEDLVPMMLVGATLGALTGYLGTFYSAELNTVKMFTTTIIGCITNVLVNLVLTPTIGVMSASVAAFVSQIPVLALRLRDARIMTGAAFPAGKTALLTIALAAQAFLSIELDTSVVSLLAQLAVLAFVIFLYRAAFCSLSKKLVRLFVD